MTSNYQVPSIHKAIDVITLLSERPDLTFKEICSTLKLPASTCFNILATLEQRGLIEKDQGTSQYKPGLTLIRLGLRAYQNIDLRSVALPVMQELVADFDETSYLSVVDHGSYEGVVLETVSYRTNYVVLMPVGSKFPLYASATGKSLLAGLSDKELSAFFQIVEPVAFTPQTLVTEEALRQEIARIRQCGYAIVTNELEPNVTGVSAAIRNYQGRVVAAVSLVGLSSRIGAKVPSAVPAVLEAAQQISRALGYVGDPPERHPQQQASNLAMMDLSGPGEQREAD